MTFQKAIVKSFKSTLIGTNKSTVSGGLLKASLVQELCHSLEAVNKDLLRSFASPAVLTRS